MKDYLSILAARSLGLLPVATPRLTSWFEPASSAGGTTYQPSGPAVEAAPEMPRGATAVPVEGHASRVRYTQTEARWPPPASPAQSPGAEDRDTLRPRAAALPPTRDPAAYRNLAPAAAGRDAQPPAIVPERAQGFPASPALPAAREPERPSGARGERAPAMPSLDEIVRHLTDDRLTALERAKSRDEVRTQLAAEPRVERAPVQPAAPHEPAPARRAVRAARDASAAVPETPAVRITIGRIEVRAVMPEPPAATARPAVPSSQSATPLDEYLKQRSGAGR